MGNKFGLKIFFFIRKNLFKMQYISTNTIFEQCLVFAKIVEAWIISIIKSGTSFILGLLLASTFINIFIFKQPGSPLLYDLDFYVWDFSFPNFNTKKSKPSILNFIYHIKR